jgi:hypothetical protein
MTIPERNVDIVDPKCAQSKLIINAWITPNVFAKVDDQRDPRCCELLVRLRVRLRAREDAVVDAP